MSAGAPHEGRAGPAGVRRVTEARTGAFPLFAHPEWSQRWPWLAQGTTGPGEDALDLGLFGAVPVGEALDRWRRLREAAGVSATTHARQVHGARVLWHPAPGGALSLHEDADGHATRHPDLLLTVSVADCVPIFLVAPARRAVALLHGGWRGVAAGILEAGIELLRQRADVRPHELVAHCGPAICGDCYEVGPEVMQAFGYDTGGRKARLDVRAEIAARALAAGIEADNLTLSTHCTRCGAPAFWSHRGGCRERQMGVLGVRA